MEIRVTPQAHLFSKGRGRSEERRGRRMEDDGGPHFIGPDLDRTWTGLGPDFTTWYINETRQADGGGRTANNIHPKIIQSRLMRTVYPASLRLFFSTAPARLPRETGSRTSPPAPPDNRREVRYRGTEAVHPLPCSKFKMSAPHNVRSLRSLHSPTHLHLMYIYHKSPAITSSSLYKKQHTESTHSSYINDSLNSDNAIARPAQHLREPTRQGPRRPPRKGTPAPDRGGKPPDHGAQLSDHGAQPFQGHRPGRMYRKVKGQAPEQDQDSQAREDAQETVRGRERGASAEGPVARGHAPIPGGELWVA